MSKELSEVKISCGHGYDARIGDVKRQRGKTEYRLLTKETSCGYGYDARIGDVKRQREKTE
jgi:hypothetical protein